MLDDVVRLHGGPAWMEDEIEPKIEVGGLNWSMQELRDEVDPQTKVRG